MVKKLLRAKIEFFDTNPIGRIQNRFSKDIKVLDFLLPFVGNLMLSFFFKILGIFILIAVSIYYAIPLLIILTIVILCTRFIVLKVQQDSQRQESISEGPINTKLNQCMDGL